MLVPRSDNSFPVIPVPMQHPRPLLRRDTWRSLDGPWHFAFDDAAAWQHPAQVHFGLTIQVPYAPEAPASGIGDTALHRRFWYARRVDVAGLRRAPGDRLLVHFGAVDYSAQLWVDGQRAGFHRGGHAPFTVDVTDFVDPAAPGFDLALLAEDDPLEMSQPRGKQDWQAEPHSIWYPRTSGIWRSVWIEAVPAAHVTRLRWTPDISSWRMGLDARIAGDRGGLTLAVVLSVDGLVIADDRIAVHRGRATRELMLTDPGIDDAREDWMWWPEHPQLIDARIELLDAEGRVVDRIEAYTAMRSVRTEDGEFLLNDRPYPLRMVLDQGYWPDTLMTADSERLRRDVELIRLLGFNGARKHQKSEDPRWLYWADRIGLCVWSEMPSPYAFGDDTVHNMMHEWRALVERDLSQPCVVAWVPVNESWGVPALPRDPRQVDLVRALYHMTRALDGTRPVVGNDGWEMPCGDIISIHDYTDELDELMRRYGTLEALARTLVVERPGGGRKLMLDGYTGAGKPAMLTEFGGIAPVSPDAEGAWAYSNTGPGEDFGRRYVELMAVVHELRAIKGFCYTQLTDTFTEQNGLLTADRQFKADPAVLTAATRGRRVHPRIWRAAVNPLGYSRRWLKKHPTVNIA
jgi:beta-galactosidase/beta-glucuronidase